MHDQKSWFFKMYITPALQLDSKDSANNIKKKITKALKQL